MSGTTPPAGIAPPPITTPAPPPAAPPAAPTAPWAGQQGVWNLGEGAAAQPWYEAIPEAMRPRRDQPFYHLMAENEDASYIAYVSQQNLLGDADSGPVDHPGLPELFEDFDGGRYPLRRSMTH